MNVKCSLAVQILSKLLQVRFFVSTVKNHPLPEPITEHELDKMIDEAKKQEEPKHIPDSSPEEYTEFYSAAATNAVSNGSQERLTVDDLAAELQEIQVIEKKGTETGPTVEMTEKKSTTGESNVSAK